MRLVEYSDLGDAPEFRIEAVGSIVLVSPNIVRISYVAKRPDSAHFGAVVHHFWDVSQFLTAFEACRCAPLALRKERAVLTNARPAEIAH